MIYAPFYEYFPEIADKETRAIIVFDDPELPSGDYGLVDSYCNEHGCDCRRIFLNVVSSKATQILAVIAYGWESKEYYAKWMGDDDPIIIGELKGPSLNMGSPQSELAPVLLKRMKSVLEDKNYVERLKRHYKIFKEAVEKKH